MYEFKTEPYEHQKVAFDKSWNRNAYALFMEMGTGKTKVAIDTLAALYEAGQVEAALVIAPKGVYANWVNKEIPQHLPDRIERKVVLWHPKNLCDEHRSPVHQERQRRGD
jgi:superfamily II DNA or RNA helicase